MVAHVGALSFCDELDDGILELLGEAGEEAQGCGMAMIAFGRKEVDCQRVEDG